MTKEQLKQKEHLKELASDIGFESVMFANEFVNSNREELRYKLWLWELTLWLNKTFDGKDFKSNTVYTTDVESYLIGKIKQYQNINKLPKKIKK